MVVCKQKCDAKKHQNRRFAFVREHIELVPAFVRYPTGQTAFRQSAVQFLICQERLISHFKPPRSVFAPVHCIDRLRTKSTSSVPGYWMSNAMPFPSNTPENLLIFGFISTVGTISLSPKNAFDDCMVLRIFAFQLLSNFLTNNFLAFLQFGGIKKIKCSCGIAAAFN